jgi:hypothetical protein
MFLTQNFSNECLPCCKVGNENQGKEEIIDLVMLAIIAEKQKSQWLSTVEVSFMLMKSALQRLGGLCSVYAVTQEAKLADWM